MKTRNWLLGAIALMGAAVLLPRLFAADQPARTTYEFLTIRWAGTDNTHIIRPGGEVEFIGPQLRQLRKPDRADNRSFYLNVAMNGLSKEGWEFGGISSDDIIMRRPVAR